MFSLEQLSSLIRHRRTIKPASMDGSRLIERSTLLTLLENGTWAPTHGLTEPWRFRIYEGNARQKLADLMQKVYRQVTPAAEFREDKLVKMSENPMQSAVSIVVSMKRSVGHKVAAIEEIEAVACSVQNIMLSATAIGLGSFWSSPPLIESAAFKQQQGLHEEDHCLGILYLGWPKQTFVWPASARRPVTDFIEWVRAQRPTQEFLFTDQSSFLQEAVHRLLPLPAR